MRDITSRLWELRNSPLVEEVITEMYRTNPRNKTYQANVQCFDLYKRDLSMGIDEQQAYKNSMCLLRDLKTYHHNGRCMNLNDRRFDGHK